ncbi:MAG TPA: AAA family ATPase [Polyangiaceae bacterium]|jgi:DNA helicase-2/ATP-dependent DNA helicase PcrA|nr:MAG: Helicase IV [Deltaproteobacteria bacterium ADurb.Bin207]HNS97352.1 AAA family ATPase [Polyangiaceae bacterium]HNZ21778.1 AAA family ATPase [Polyangiaceae bacterium]HOD23498.1 AAA family ATPase [Polyangiaceae bacterium]HOG99661.1 AAA family ATPase [Polyangiaceae bacterium]
MDPVALASRLDDEFRTSCSLLDNDNPWFGYVTLRSGDRLREYRIGRFRTVEHHIVPVTHPIARALMECEPGDDFEVDREGLNQIKGVVEIQGRLETQQRALHVLHYSDVEREAVVVRGHEGFELRVDTARKIDAQTGLPDILALLSREQYRVIAQHSDSPIILQGRAGSGKTSVALYRVAWMANPVMEGKVAVDPSRVLIVMFNKALSLFVRDILPSLGLQQAVLDTFHGWALHRVSDAYKGDIKIDSSPYPGKEQAVRMKKRLGILHAVEVFVREQRLRIAEWLRTKLAPYKGEAWAERFDVSNEPVVRALVEIRRAARQARDVASGFERQRLEQVALIFDGAVERVRKYKEELMAILTDMRLLQKCLPEESSQDLQALATYQKTLQHRDASPRRPGPYIGFEDLAILLRLIQIKNGGLPSAHDLDTVERYDHLVIDEVQDFGAVELKVLLDAVRSRMGVTIAGDLNQKIVPEADFIGWDALIAELGIAGARVSRLEVAHRSTGSIMRVADSILGETSNHGRFGTLPTLTFTEGEERQRECAEERIRAVLRDHPLAHVCVVARHRASVQSLSQDLGARLSKDGVDVRIGHNDSFAFRPGVTVTNMRQVKGLEFDAVIVLDATDESYPDTEQGKRNIYTVVSRAKDRLDIVCPGTLSRWLEEAKERGLVDVAEMLAVVPVSFSEEELTDVF